MFSKLPDKKFLLYLLSVSFIIRLITSIINTYPPSIPHDFYAYITAGEQFLHGILYTEIIPANGKLVQYGTLYSALMGTWIYFFGKDYILLKFPSIFFDMGTIVVIYCIVRDLYGSEKAKYASLLYSFSYITLSNVMLGQDDHMFMFFMILSLYYLLKRNLLTSSVFLSISILFKATPLVVVPPILYYVLKTHGTKNLLKYLSVVIAVFVLVILPFYTIAGINVFYPYLPHEIFFSKTMSETTGLPISQAWPIGSNFFTLYHYLDYYLYYGINSPYENYQPSEDVVRVFEVNGVLLLMSYLGLCGLKDKKIELIRNMFLFIFTPLMFGVQFDPNYILWLMPFIIFLFVNKINTNIDGTKIMGLILVSISIIISASLYQWDIEYSALERILILLGCFMAGSGTWLTFNKTVGVMVFGSALWLQQHAYILKLFGFIIPELVIKKFAWGIMVFGINVLMVIAMMYLVYRINSISRPTSP